MDEWFVERNIDEVRQDAIAWKDCNTEDARRKHTSKTLVRWSEMHRLSYFNSVRFLVVDLMHCLFLGIAKWIIKLWIDEDVLTPHNLALMENQAKNMQIPVDIGRIPYKIAMEKGFQDL